MEFEWDENKRISNIEKHGFDFIDAWQLFDNEYIRERAKLGKNGERRFLAVGFVRGCYASVIYTMRGNIVRIISLRKARENEQRKHQTLHGE